MNMKTKQSISINNKLAMTLEIQLAIKLLQLNSVDLQKEIDENILSNPFLENENSSELVEVTSEVPVISSIHSNEKYSDNLNEAYEQLPSTHETLHEYLMWQIRLSSMNQNDQFIAYNIIDYINDHGYLTESMEDLFLLLKKDLEINFQEIFAVLHKIQHLDPIGVGAASLKDCLMIQLEYYHKSNTYFSKVKKIIDKLEDTINPSSSSIESFMLECTKKDAADSKAIQLLRSLNPKPGNIISESLGQEHIIPDIIISKKDGKWLTELNPEINPKIRINKTYQKLIQDIPSGKDREYVKKHFQDAKFFLKALQNRNITILKVAKVIFQKQVSFLSQGEIAMKPLTLKDIAKTIAMHESTISRCTNNKYVQTSRGVFEMKYFFSSELNTDFGNMVSSRAIKSMLEKIISGENKDAPLSDSEIANSLSNNGIKVARRTITKYRETLSIPSSTKRKTR